MGFLKRLLSKDPETLLAKAEQALRRGQGVQALSHLDRLPDGLPESLARRARDVGTRASGIACEAAVTRARELEEAGLLAQAIAQLEAAREHCTVPNPTGTGAGPQATEGPTEDGPTEDGPTAEGLTAEIQRLQLLAQDDGASEPPLPADPDDFELDADQSYEMLVATLDDRVVELYQDRPEAFRRACVNLHEGRTEEALAVFDELARQSPDDAACRFERGNCLLALGRASEARANLEAAWPALGDDPLDAAGTVSVPLLWADAALELGEHEAIAARLAEPARPEHGRPGLSIRLAAALLELQRVEEAAEHLDGCCRAWPREATFAHLFATTLARLGQPADALEVLEAAIAPSCAGGSCGRPALHLPSLRMAAALHLDEGGATSRVRELLQFIEGSLRGELESVDHYLLARLHAQEDDEEGAALELERARELLPPGDEALRRQIDELTGRVAG